MNEKDNIKAVDNQEQINKAIDEIEEQGGFDWGHLKKNDEYDDFFIDDFEDEVDGVDMTDGSIINCRASDLKDFFVDDEDEQEIENDQIEVAKGN